MIGPPTAYSLYGLAVETTVPLECPRATVSTPDVRLCAASSSFFADVRRSVDLSPTPDDWFESRGRPDGSVFLRWANLFEFLVESEGRCIRYRRLRHASDESLQTYLLGQVLSFSLLSRGVEPFHATGVAIDGEAVAFLGDCGNGKSTLGAAFISRGYPLLTDDLLAIERRDGRWVAHAGPPRLKVFPPVATKVLARETADRLNPHTSKLILPLGAHEVSASPIPLRALYVLPGPADRGPRTRRISVEPLRGQKAFLELVRSAFNLIRVDSARLENQFATVTRLVNDIPLRRLTYPRRLSSLNGVCDAVIADALAH